jgi:SAM-dependent methyltransferase
MSPTEQFQPPVTFPETADIETSTDEYAARFSGPAGAWMLEMQAGITLGILRKFPGGTVLDVGGGHGQLALPLTEGGWDVTVLGSSPECRKRIAGAVDEGKCRFTVGNVVGLPFPDRSFDVSISFRLLTHCRQWPVLVRELCRVARHAVVVDYPTSQSLNRIAPSLFSLKKRVEVNTRPWALFTHAQVAAEFSACGFPALRRNPQFLLPMVLHRAVGLRGFSAAAERLSSFLGLTRRWGSPVILEAGRQEGHPG